jgi:hypothetical protein
VPRVGTVRDQSICPRCGPIAPASKHVHIPCNNQIQRWCFLFQPHMQCMSPAFAHSTSACLHWNSAAGSIGPGSSGRRASPDAPCAPGWAAQEVAAQTAIIRGAAGKTVAGVQIGHIAHLGGALAGVAFVLLLSRLPAAADPAA